MSEIEMVSISCKDLRDLLDENLRLHAKVKELMTSMSDMVGAQLHRQVREFHVKYNHPVRYTPEVPPDDEVRFRLRLIAEEFLELFSSAIGDDELLEHVGFDIQTAVQHAKVAVDLPEFIDAIADLMYVLEGSAAQMGVHMPPVLAEVQRANMSKDANGPDKKPVKPKGWTPPDIARILREQGWRPHT